MSIFTTLLEAETVETFANHYGLEYNPATKTLHSPYHDAVTGLDGVEMQQVNTKAELFKLLGY